MRALIWIVGDWQHEVFRDAVAFLEQNAACRFCGDPSAALAESAPAGDAPRVIVIAQSRPGQFGRGDVERLHVAAPLARLIVLTGPWCEGEGRSGRPWPGVTRVPWRSWRSRLGIEFDFSRSSVHVERQLPRTATEGERIERSVAALGMRRFDGLAHVYSQSRLTFETLADGLGQLGLRAVWRNVNEEMAPTPPAVAVLDGWENVPADCPARSVLLLHFPRPDDAAQVAEIGIAAILPQPLLLAELAETLASLLPSRQERREVVA